MVYIVTFTVGATHPADSAHYAAKEANEWLSKNMVDVVSIDAHTIQTSQTTHPFWTTVVVAYRAYQPIG